MKIIGFTLSYWDEKHPPDRFEEWCSLPRWGKTMVEIFGTSDLFIASGTWSDPAMNPTPYPVVNAGAPNNGEYNGWRRHYGKCAFTAAMAYALNMPPSRWDVMVCLDTDSMIGEVDFTWLIPEFLEQPEILACPGWHGYPGGPLMLFKREAASRLLHRRTMPNLADDWNHASQDWDEDQIKTIWEQECGHIFRGGRWWNPWPKFPTLLCDTPGLKPLEENWPMVGRPYDYVREVYLTEKCPLVTPIWRTK